MVSVYRTSGGWVCRNELQQVSSELDIHRAMEYAYRTNAETSTDGGAASRGEAK